MITKARIIKKAYPKDTLMEMSVGETIVIPFRILSSASIKTAATRAKQKKEGRFFVSVDELGGKTQITRLK
ncbi:MAG: hypothetical protein PHV53_11095 [Fermentimonas sp.]|nr:hypothetical protein [Fermentimonas sp.]